MIEMLNRKVVYQCLSAKKKKWVVVRECIIVVNERENVASEIVQGIIDTENGENKKKETKLFISFLAD